MYLALGLVVFFGIFYTLGRLERKRKMLYFRNVLKIFHNEQNEIHINEKTKVVISDPVPYGDTVKYDINVVFESVTVEQISLAHKLSKDETVTFKGPWKHDIYKVLRNKYAYYTGLNKPNNVVEFNSNNVVQLKSKEELYADRYKKYIATRAYS